MQWQLYNNGVTKLRKILISL